MENLERYKVHISIDGFELQTPVTGSGVDGLTVAQVEPIGSCELSPGDPSPIGRCPQTGDLVYLDRPKDRVRLHAEEMFNLLVDILTPGITHAGILNDGRKLLAKLGKDVMATPSAAIDALITNHVFRYQTDTIERLAADTSDDNDPRGVPLVIRQARSIIAPVLDYEAAATAAGWTIGPDDTDAGTFGYEGHGRFARDFPTRAEAARLCCELNGLDASEIPMEHWSVSESIAVSLRRHGETVTYMAGSSIWSRRANGNLHTDPVLNLISKDV